jgi:hypothetical protein
MTSDLGAELRAMLADRDPGPAPAALRARAEAIPVRLRPSSPRLWAGLGAVAILLGLPRLALDRGTAASPQTAPSAVSSPLSQSSAMPSEPASPSPGPSNGSPYAQLTPGETASLDCGADFPWISPSGSLVVCDGKLRTWPGFRVVANLPGIPDGWGTIAGREQLLVFGPKGTTASLIDGTGVVISIPDTGPGTTVEWSSDARAILIVSGVRTGSVEVATWSPIGTRTLGSLSMAGHVISAATASTNGSWLAGTESGCIAGGACKSSVGIARAGGPSRLVADRIDGLVSSTFASDDGGLIVLIAIGSEIQLWTAEPSGPLSLKERATSRWVLGQTIALAGSHMTSVDLQSRQITAMALPPGVAASDVLAVGVDGSFAVRVSSGFRIIEPDRSSLAVGAPVAQTSSADLAPGWLFVLGGPPPTTLVTRR